MVTDVRQQQHRAAIALGSNLGEPRQILEEALQVLDRTPGIRLDRQSPIYETAAVGPPQPDYLNIAAILDTTLTPFELLNQLLAIEAQFGRVRRERWGPRLLDLDLLLFDDWVIDTPHLLIPHPRMNERAFVLVPLSDVAADWVDPITGKAIAELAQLVDRTGVHRFGAPDA
ncbi:MAG: 2-amino-4-hydroxy-6-hydroxymethyldihydropteridine diphosphokinase [Kaiparowitsia implicata GSE-PSE-MK54-09C]|jgi:2-amino-4-hydroxy-6-hydroxymethyldihydropteridine diphosphokinase|nr:2-amino-4-hydroxy-6-hydroxymethyldihydropteridine diphosphokinase [Kaiparowitsia implicata GSE-PSE-MK54-09C]